MIKGRCMVEVITQIRYCSWGDLRAPKSYWHDVSRIAAFIAARLQHPNPRCNGINPRISTIRVDQHKEKFGEPRVYCILASDDLVTAAIVEKNLYVTPENVDKCLLHDAVHYRRTYLDMIALAPHYRDIIIGGASYWELLKLTKADMLIWLDTEENENNVKSYLPRWNVGDVSELRDKLSKVYDQASI